MQCKHYWFSVTEAWLKEHDVNLLDVLEKYRTIKKWAYILHNNDVYNLKDEQIDITHKAGTKKPNHYHVYCNFGNQSLNHEYFAGLFKIEANMVQRITSTAANCLLYFVHGTRDSIAEGKYQYSWKNVVHSSNWSPQVLAEQVRYIGNFDDFSYIEQIEKVKEITDVSERIKATRLLNDAYNAELQYRMTRVRRYMQVIFITGGTGSGKTTYARQFIEKANYFDIVPKELWSKKFAKGEKPFKALDYGISGGNNDPLENYKGQEAYILDDLRDTSMTLDNLLKFVDNYTNSAVKSRFTNKCFFGSLLIITSIVPLCKWYKQGDIKASGEDLNQLYRRINTYVEVDEKEIRIYSKINAKGEPCGNIRCMRNRTKEYYADQPKPIDIGDVMFNLFGEDDYVSSLDSAFSNITPQERMQLDKK